tara:strand:- start:123 stop:536 length:414 start_codon:yes stop_codon:yes gene_type:complete
MKKIFSKTSGQLLHIVHRVSDFNLDSREDLVDADNFLQQSTIPLNSGTTFKAHKHLFKEVDFKKYMAQESWVVIKGKVRCHFYDLDDSLIEEIDLNAGDCSITLTGGHTYTGLEDNSLVREFKTGPYRGQKLDKQFI